MKNLVNLLIPETNFVNLKKIRKGAWGAKKTWFYFEQFKNLMRSRQFKSIFRESFTSL